MKAILLVAHRWAGLTIALAVLVTGLTGAILPWQDQLRSWFAPQVWNAGPPTPGAEPLSGIELVRRVERETGGIVSYIPLAPDPSHAQSIFLSSPPGAPPLDFEQVFVDPYSGEIRARVRFGDLRDGAINLMPFLVNFHYSLASGNWGRFLLGLAAFIWCLEAVAGLLLTVPRALRAGWRRRLRQWGRAWRIRGKPGSGTFTFDLHRASGLWLWPMTLVFGWSAVAFNLDVVHEPVQRFFGGEGLYQPVPNPTPDAGGPMSMEDAAATGARLMAREAAEKGFTVHAPGALSLNPYNKVIGYYARTSLDGPTENASTAVWFDQASGRQLAFRQPFGDTRADAVDKAMRMLHTADLFGWPYKVLVTLFGLLTSIMALAGVILWLKRSNRRWRKAGFSTPDS
ncbi:MAG TPA: PepSY-associated TM helix domain-containing protein [Croceibacterium sp.]|nr:PepSY-associated TM helix domain-containing protein [Croceibacterium sp.]